MKHMKQRELQEVQNHRPYISKTTTEEFREKNFPGPGKLFSVFYGRGAVCPNRAADMKQRELQEV